MANSRLYIYDKKTNSAACIAKGLSTWSAGLAGNDKHLDDFFDYAAEYICNIDCSRYELKMEHEIYEMNPLPKVFYEESAVVALTKKKIIK